MRASVTPMKTDLALAAATLAAGLSVSAPSAAATFADVRIDPSVAITATGDAPFYDAASSTLFGLGPVDGSTGLSAPLAPGADFIDLFAEVTAGGSAGTAPVDDLVLISGGFEPLLTGDLVDVTFGPTIGGFGSGIQMLFATTSGILGDDIGPLFALTLFGFPDADGISGPTGLPDFPFGTGSYEINAVAVPLPAAAPMLLTGGVWLAFVSRRRKRIAPA